MYCVQNRRCAAMALQMSYVNRYLKRFFVFFLLTVLPTGVLFAQGTLPVLSVEPVEQGEDYPVVARFDEAVGKAAFRIRLSTASSEQVQVTFITRLLRDDWYQRNFPGVETCLWNIDAWEAGEDCPATPGKDFYGLSRSLTFQPGETEKFVSVQIVNDPFAEQDQLFNVLLVQPRNAQLAPDIGDPASELLVIIDDDDRGDGITVSVEDNGEDGESIGVGEGDGQTNVMINLNRPSTTPVSVIAFTEQGDATEGEDYTGVRERIVFQPGETSISVPVKIIDDREVERVERFKLRLTESTGAYIATRMRGFPNRTIYDNDRVPNVTLRPNFSIIKEGDGTVSFDVKLSDNVAEPSSVLVYTRGTGSAEAAKDYWGFSQQVEFDSSGYSRVNLTVIDDDVAESAETLELRLVNPENAVVVGAALPVVIVDDDDPSALPVVVARFSDFLEARGGGVFSVSLSQPSDKVVRVLVFSQNLGEAKPGEDFYGFTRTVEFAPGTTRQTFDYTIIDDSMFEDEERISFQVKVLENAVLPQTPYIVTHIIEDTD